MAQTTQPQVLGRYLVADPDICHGKPTFRGTRILVADVLEQVAAGLAWETIIEEWRGSITQEGIAEAVRLARQALLEHTAEYIVGPTAASMETNDARFWRGGVLFALYPRLSGRVVRTPRRDCQMVAQALSAMRT